MKSFKSLFIKDEEGQEEEPSSEKHEFPVTSTDSVKASPTPSTNLKSNPFLEEIMEVYDKGLQSMNMPGYDFFDFFNAVQAAGAQTEPVFKMAYQMGKTMNTNITPEKLVTDAEYYVRKINQVHQSYSDQGNRKLEDLDTQLKNDKSKLLKQAEQLEAEISKLKQQILSLESNLTDARSNLGKADENYRPQQADIRLKLEANDHAMRICIQQLNAVKDNILKFLK